MAVHRLDESPVAQILGRPPKALTDCAQEFNEELDSYPTFVAGFARSAEQVGVAS